ncbi:hypothetical protein Bbelb_108550 [Branchiostoma belcheri]|nr:hypothetical protein Bbelb_108550 [Branchiostoma belcheri]
MRKMKMKRIIKRRKLKMGNLMGRRKRSEEEEKVEERGDLEPESEDEALIIDRRAKRVPLKKPDDKYPGPERISNNTGVQIWNQLPDTVVGNINNNGLQSFKRNHYTSALAPTLQRCRRIHPVSDGTASKCKVIGEDSRDGSCQIGPESTPITEITSAEKQPAVKAGCYLTEPPPDAQEFSQCVFDGKELYFHAWEKSAFLNAQRLSKTVPDPDPSTIQALVIELDRHGSCIWLHTGSYSPGRLPPSLPSLLQQLFCLHGAERGGRVGRPSRETDDGVART